MDMQYSGGICMYGCSIIGILLIIFLIFGIWYLWILIKKNK